MIGKNLLFLVLLFLVLDTSAQTTFEKKPSPALEKFIKKIKSTPTDSIIYYFDKGVALAKSENNIEAQTQLNTFLVQSLYVGGKHDKTISYFLKAVREFENLDPYDERILLYFEGSGVYSKNNDLESALKFINKGLKDAEAIKSNILLADAYNRTGVILEKKELLDSAMTYYQKSLKLNESVDHQLGLSYSLDNISGIYGAKNQPLKALPYQRRSLAIRKKLNERFSISIALINMSESFNLLNQLDSAIFYAKQSLEISTDINFPDLQQYTLNHLSDIYRKKGDFKTALKYKNDGIILKDSIFNETKSKQIQELTTKYETEKKEEKIKDLNQQAKIKDLEITRKNSFLIFGLVLFIVASALVWLYFNRRKIKNKIELQNEIIKQQDLATKAVLDAEERERRRIAGDLHDGVGQLLSVSLLNMNNFLSHTKSNLDADQFLLGERTLSLINESYDEMRTISHQMMPNSLLKAGLSTAVREFLQKIDDKDLKISIDISGLDQRLDERTETVLYRIIQESVNNTIKHAKASLLSIQLVKDEEGINLSIEDNGVGFDLNQRKDGIGLENIKSRITFINGTVEYDTSPGKGTLVHIFIPTL